MQKTFTEWLYLNPLRGDTIVREEFEEVKKFIRDLSFMLWEDSVSEPVVISKHAFRNLLFPVYKFVIEKCNLVIIMRHNFYDWKISIDSKEPIFCDYLGIIDENETIGPQQCEGFPLINVYKSYSENKYSFTVSLKSKYDVYTFLYMTKKYLEKKYCDN